MSISTALEVTEDGGTDVLNAKEDRYGRFMVNLEEPMDPKAFASLLESSMSKWRDQGKKVVWLKMPSKHENLREVVRKAGFWIYSIEPGYWMFLRCIANTADTLPANASLHVGNRAYVINAKREGNTITNCAIPRTHMLASTAMEAKDTGTNVVNAVEDSFGGVTVYLDETMDPTLLAFSLQSSMSNWRDQGKNIVWIKLPKAQLNLLCALQRAGFRPSYDEGDYMILVHRIPNTADTLRANASHCVGIKAFVINDKREVLVVQGCDGWFKSSGVWKLLTGTVKVGEDISAAAIREVKEQTGIDTNFVEILAFRQSHKCFFEKSDLLFVCMLEAHSFDIQTQTSEMPATKWMDVEDYADQPFVKLIPSLDSVAKICLAKLGGNYTGLAPLPSLACDCQGFDCETMDHSGCSS